MNLTPKQIEVLRVIAGGNPDKTVADLDQIIERVSYKPTKAAIQFSIRALVEHGLIEKTGSEKRRGRLRVLIQPTDLGKHFAAALSPRPVTAILETETEVQE